MTSLPREDRTNAMEKEKNRKMNKLSRYRRNSGKRSFSEMASSSTLPDGQDDADSQDETVCSEESTGIEEVQQEHLEQAPAEDHQSSKLSDKEKDMYFQEINMLRKEKDTLQAELEQANKLLQMSRLDPSVLTDDKQSKFLTGISLSVFLTLVTFLTSISKKKMSNIMPLPQQLLITLVKLRHNIPFEYLSLHTGFAKSTIADIFWRVIDLLHLKLDFLIHWPDRETLQATIPPVFKALFPRLTGIMDCFEIFIDRPKKLKARAEVYSNYKKHSTVKAFIVCSPLGAVTYISSVWGGRASDVEIVRQSGFIDPALHFPGDQLLGDRGFTLAEEFAIKCRAELLIPSFTKGKKQLSARDVEVSRKLASVRIHIERIIGLMKNRYTILQGPLPIPLIRPAHGDEGKISGIDKLIRVCGALVNLGETIVYKEN